MWDLYQRYKNTQDEPKESDGLTKEDLSALELNITQLQHNVYKLSKDLDAMQQFYTPVAVQQPSSYASLSSSWR